MAGASEVVGKPELLSDQIARLTDTIGVCDRLCLLSARSVVQCAIPAENPQTNSVGVAGSTSADKPSLAFIPSVSCDSHRVVASEDLEGDGGRVRTRSEGRHLTTSAQCISALQALLPIVFRFRLGTQESRDLAFHPIERSSLKVFEPDSLGGKIRDTISQGLNGLLEADTKLGVGTGKHLASTTFGALHPFTAAQVLRAIAPSAGLFGPVWWLSLFVILWFLNRRTGSLAGHPNTQATDSPGTAFLTSKCVDAVEVVFRVFERRRDRFRRLIALMIELKSVNEKRRCLQKLGKTGKPNNGLLSLEIFGAGYDYKEDNLIAEIRACIDEIALDTGVGGPYQRWKEELDKRMPSDRPIRREEAAAFSDSVVDSFAKAFADSKVSAGIKGLTESADHHVKFIKEFKASVVRIRKTIGDSFQPDKFSGSKSSATASTASVASAETRGSDDATESDLDRLPRWTCSSNYRAATLSTIRKAAANGAASAKQVTPRELEVLRNLETHWHRHQHACEGATTTIEECNNYLLSIFEAFTKLTTADVGKQKKNAAGDKRAAVAAKAIKRSASAIGANNTNSADRKLTLFLDSLSGANEYLSRLRERLVRDKAFGERWAEVLMNRHLTYASSGAMAQFDPGELAHALRVVCRSEQKVRFDTILTALRAVCAAQRQDGTWPCNQPFYWTDTGLAAATLSVGTASAVVSTVGMLVRNPERFGASQDQVSEGLRSAFDALDAFFRWLSETIQSFPLPQAMIPHDSSASREPDLYGWCSDRVYEPGRIHSWVTANAIEFLVEFRGLLQDRINFLLRAEFLSYHPSELKPLAEVEPTDLSNLGKPIETGPVISRLLQLLRPHKALELAEGPWLPSQPSRPSIPFFSGIFYGPPGTSKTFLAKAIAAELGWPIISLSPADFLARGDQQIESRAQEIFSSLKAGSRIVYFFDEIDELIRDRRQMTETERSVFSFLTPSFLTKLQEFRDAAKKNEFIFIIGTNYFERIDSAAKRSGRIDQSFPIVYADLPSRGYMIIEYLLKKYDPEKANMPQSLSDQLIDATSDTERRAAILAYQATRAREYLVAIQQEASDIKLASKASRRAGGVRLIDEYAKFTGFLSYTAIDELNKIFKQKPSRDSVKDLIGHLHAIYRGQSDRFKPEIALSDYADRLDAVAEMAKVAKVIPRDVFPWSDEDMKGGGATPQFERQEAALFAAVKEKLSGKVVGKGKRGASIAFNKFKAEFKKKLREERWSPRP